MESLLLNAANSLNYFENYKAVFSFLKDDVDKRLLKIQLETFSLQFQTQSAASTTLDFQDMKEFFSHLTLSQKELLFQVVKVFKFILLAPASNAVSKRSCSSLRRTKTWLRTTMTQERLNHCLLLHVHKSLTDNLPLTSIANEFASGNNSRLRIFGSSN